MNKILLTTLFIICTYIGFAQVSAPGGNVFQTQNIYTGYTVSGNDIMLPVYRSGDDAAGNTYFSKSWVKGAVKTTDNNEFKDHLVFMYDKVTNKLYFKKEDSATIMEADQNKIYSFTLNTDKPHVFMRGAFFSPDYKNKFFEVLTYNPNAYSLFKYTITSFEKPETSRASQAMTQSISYGKYVDEVKYFIYYNNLLQPVELKKKSFSKSMGSNADKIEAYIKNNNGNFNESYVANMLQEVNKDIK